MSERMIVVILPSEQYVRYILARMGYTKCWDGDDVLFILDQHGEVDIYNASTLKQQSTGRHVAPLGHIVMIPSHAIIV